jgi:hypothetical protein
MRSIYKMTGIALQRSYGEVRCVVLTLGGGVEEREGEGEKTQKIKGREKPKHPHANCLCQG